jgi:hypothetical protein
LKGPGRGIQVESGRVIFPGYHCDLGNTHWDGHNSTTHAHSLISDDFGNSWTLGGVTGPGGNEAQLVALNSMGNHLMINMRNYYDYYDADGGHYRLTAER